MTDPAHPTTASSSVLDGDYLSDTGPGRGLRSPARSWLQSDAPTVSLDGEWAFRLLADPRRLWKRYLVTGPRIFRLVREHHPGDTPGA